VNEMEQIWPPQQLVSSEPGPKLCLRTSKGGYPYLLIIYTDFVMKTSHNGDLAPTA